MDRVILVVTARHLRLTAWGLAALLLIWGVVLGGRALRSARQEANADSSAWYAAPRFDVDVTNRPARGSLDARVTIVEFTDYLCPFCRRYATGTLPGVLATHGGRVRYVVRNFPVQPVNPMALPAAEAVECANRQGRFWEYREALFGESAPLTGDQLVALAARAGLDTAAFGRCARQRATRSIVERDLLDAWAYGVSGTPTFFINGRRFRGLRSRGQLDRYIAFALGER